MHAHYTVTHATTITCAVTFADADTTNTSSVSSADTATYTSPYVATNAITYTFADVDTNASTTYSSYPAFRRS